MVHEGVVAGGDGHLPETADILKIVRNLDPKAFVSVASVTGVYGQGFGIIDGGMLNGMKKN